MAEVEAHLSRIQQHDATLRAWVFVDRAGALETAGTLEAEARAGRFRGPLHGVPVAVKDIFDVAGMVTTSGAPSFAHRRPARDADAVARLRAAGAIVVGKTTTTPFAYADPTGTRNPWNREHTPGGSSAGSAAAVAARMVPAALGSQTVGSTLRPAAYCGIVGLKPTYGLLSTAGVTPLSWSLDHVGIFAQAVDDAALMLSVLTGSSDADDPCSERSRPFILRQAQDERSASRRAPGRAPRLGVPHALFDDVANRDVRRHCEAVAGEFTQAGAQVEEVALPASAGRIGAAGQVVLRAEAAAFHAGWFAAQADAYEPKIRGLIESGLGVSAVDYVNAQRERRQFQEEMHPILDRYDALLMPVAPAPAPPISEGTTGDPVFCAPWSFGGFPAVALPSGLSADGLPLAIQLVAGVRAEPRLLGVARWCEARLCFTAVPSLGV